MPGHSSEGITQLLQQWSEGKEKARDELMSLVYDELRRVTASYLHRECRDQTLHPTILVNELFLKFSEPHPLNRRSRMHFFGVAAKLMRRVLVDYALKRSATGRDSDRYSVSVEDAGAFDFERNADLLMLDEVLNRLEERDPVKARIVELRFFGGRTIEETAEVMQISIVKVKRDWNFARSYIKREFEMAGPKDMESEAWRTLSAKRLQDAYADDEEDYSLNLIKEKNTEYE